MKPMGESSVEWPEVREALARISEARVVIWDFDGVIANTEPLHAQTYRTLLNRHGYWPGEDWFKPFIGYHESITWAKFAEAGWPVATPIDELIAERRTLFTELALRHLRPSWIVAQLAPIFAQTAQAQFTVSAGDPETVQTLLTDWGLKSDLPPFPRPAGVSKQEALASLLSPNALILEDNYGYLQQAGQAGTYRVGVIHELSPTEALPADVLLSL